MRLTNVAFLLFLLLLPLPTLSTDSVCPSICGCKSNTYNCSVCLQRYYRTVTKDLKCPCMDGFKQKSPAAEYCCPWNCTSCTDMGCVSCSTTMQTIFNPNLQVFVCTCKSNRYLGSDKLNPTCFCSSRLFPTQFYYNPETETCKRCPMGCTCNASGCVDCSGDGNRTVRVGLGMMICPCSMEVLDKYEGCFCYGGCECGEGGVNCTEKSNRTLLQGRWVCRNGYVEQDGVCVCTEPYQMVNGTCQCPSKTTPTQYYSFREECFACPYNCTCNQMGCVFCQPSMNRQVDQYNRCPCKPPFIFSTICVCVEPYFLTSSSSCQCLSSLYPQTYYTDNSSVCKKCPKGCRCNLQDGCHNCSVASLRDAKCQCVRSAVEVDGVCGCNNQSYLVAGECRCADFLGAYRDLQGVCVGCPKGCKCEDEKGCYECEEAVHRTVKESTTTGVYTCGCSPTFQQDGFGNCICRKNSYFNQNTSTCDCLPLFFDSNGTCLCLSFQPPTNTTTTNTTTNSQLYNYDSYDDICGLCPIGCICDDLGCHDCSPFTLRFSIVIGNRSQCPCFQNSTLKDNVCTVCEPRYYYFSGNCVFCRNCKTCNAFGCTSCNEDMHLDGKYNQCVCNDKKLENVQNVCRCSLQKYLDAAGNCTDCPVQCDQCSLNDTTNKVTCVSCRILIPTRINSPQSMCPCLPSHNQLGTKQPYCCNSNCSNCNQYGCTQCPFASFRYLNIHTNSCDCVNNMMANGSSVVCVCGEGWYRFGSMCVQCPPNCKGCEFSFGGWELNCTVCREGENREMDPGTDCECLPGFLEMSPVGEYCYPEKCEEQTRTCKKCKSPWVPSQDGLKCVCPIGLYNSSMSQCLRCTMPGCIQCKQFNYCLQCNSSDNYYLTSHSCKQAMNSSDFIYAQGKSGIFINIKLHGINISQYNDIKEVDIFLENIVDTLTIDSEIEEETTVSQKQAALLSPDVLQVSMANPDREFREVMIGIHYLLVFRPTRRELAGSYVVDNNYGYFFAQQDTVYLLKDRIYSQQQININDKSQTIFQIFLTVFVVLISLIIYILGFKHNQTVFYLQTIAFLGLTYNDPQLVILPYLYNLRFSYYMLGNALWELIPSGYLETSPGNFVIFNRDANIMRAGTTLLVGMLVCGMSMVFRLVILLSGKCKKERSRKWMSTMIKVLKKPIYRFLQFFYKTCMYPLLFFSIVTFRNWHARTITDTVYFLNFCRGLSISLVLLYLLWTLFSLRYQSIAKINHIQNLLQFLFDLISCIILILSDSNGFLCLTIIFIIRGCCYIYSRKKLMRDFGPIEYLRLLSVGFEVTSVFCVLARNLPLLVVMTTVTVGCQVAHEVWVLGRGWRSAKVARMYREKTKGGTNMTASRLEPEEKTTEWSKSDVYTV